MVNVTYSPVVTSLGDVWLRKLTRTSTFFKGGSSVTRLVFILLSNLGYIRNSLLLCFVEVKGHLTRRGNMEAVRPPSAIPGGAP